jgi:hypothetical protein
VNKGGQNRHFYGVDERNMSNAQNAHLYSPDFIRMIV